MNKKSSSNPQAHQHKSSIVATATLIGAAYLTAMAVLVLSEVGVITADTWLYLSMAGALLAALCGFFFGYALAVTSEARTRPAVRLAKTPQTELVARPTSQLAA